MKRVLVKIKDKNTLLALKSFGEINTVSSVLSIYALSIDEKSLDELSKIPGIINIEEDETYTVQNNRVC